MFSCRWKKPSMAFFTPATLENTEEFRGLPIAASCGGRLFPRSAKRWCEPSPSLFSPSAGRCCLSIVIRIVRRPVGEKGLRSGKKREAASGESRFPNVQEKKLSKAFSQLNDTRIGRVFSGRRITRRPILSNVCSALVSGLGRSGRSRTTLRDSPGIAAGYRGSVRAGRQRHRGHRWMTPRPTAAR